MVWDIRDRERERRAAIVRDRRSRWSARTIARVTHPQYGTIVVPHMSNFSALLNAADVWGCHWLKISDAQVSVAEPNDKPVRSPYTYK